MRCFQALSHLSKPLICNDFCPADAENAIAAEQSTFWPLPCRVERSLWISKPSSTGDLGSANAHHVVSAMNDGRGIALQTHVGGAANTLWPRRCPILPSAWTDTQSLSYEAIIVMSLLGRSLASLVVIASIVSFARAQEDLDQHKTGAQLFAADCVSCHRSPHGLAKDEFSLALWYFLRQHYTSSDASAQKLTAYLESADAPRSKPRPSTRMWKSSDTAGSGRPPRPPLPVPTH